MRKLLLFLLTLAATQVNFAQKNTDSVRVTDLLKINMVGNITVTTIEPDETNKQDYKYLTQVYSISTNTGELPLQLTSSKEGASQPAWSPDGRQLAFVRTVEGKPQIFILSMNGGEPLQLTKYKYGASSPKWSPDGKQVLFSSGIALQDLLKDSILNAGHNLPMWPFEKPGFDKNEQL